MIHLEIDLQYIPRNLNINSLNENVFIMKVCWKLTWLTNSRLVYSHVRESWVDFTMRNFVSRLLQSTLITIILNFIMIKQLPCIDHIMRAWLKEWRYQETSLLMHIVFNAIFMFVCAEYPFKRYNKKRSTRSKTILEVAVSSKISF